MKTPATDNRQRTAFTLVEVVVAVGLGVVLVVAVQGLIVHGYRASVALEQRQAAADASTLPFELLAQDLGHLPPGGGVKLSDGTLSLVTASAMQSNRVAARHAVGVRYRIVTSVNGDRRLLRQERELGQEFADDSGVLLAEGLAAATFEVFDGRQWHAVWPLPTARTALALRLTLKWPKGQPRQKTVRLVPLRWRRHDE